MAAENSIADVTLVLTLLVRGMVDHPDDVLIVPAKTDCGATVFGLTVSPGDVGKIIGRAGRNARALRLILGAMGRKLNDSYRLNIQGWEDHE